MNRQLSLGTITFGPKVADWNIAAGLGAMPREENKSAGWLPDLAEKHRKLGKFLRGRGGCSPADRSRTASTRRLTRGNRLDDLPEKRLRATGTSVRSPCRYSCALSKGRTKDLHAAGSLAINARFSSSESTKLPPSLGMLPNCIRGTLQIGSCASSEDYVVACNKIRANIGNAARPWHRLRSTHNHRSVLLVVSIRGKADDDDMNMGLPACLAFPVKRAMGEMNLHARSFAKNSCQRTPGLLALGNRVGRNKAQRRLRVPAMYCAGTADTSNDT